MEFGHFCLPTYFEDVDGSVGDFMRRFVDFLVESEELGFDSLWANEHHFDAYGGIVPSPPILLSALAQRTKRVRLGTSVIVLPLHNPIEVAEQMAMIDNLSNGRIELGVGRGFVLFDYERLGVPLEGAQDRMKESLEIILKTWRGGMVSHEGQYYRFKELELWPPPQQRPHPPVWIACSGTPASFEWAGSQGYSILTVAYRGVDPLVQMNKLYRDAWNAAGHKKGGHRISVHYQIVLAEDGREARQLCGRALDRYMGAITHTLDRVRTDQGQQMTAERRKVGDELHDVERMVEECRVIAGTPEDAVRVLSRAHDRMGFTSCDCTFYFGGLSFAEARRSQRLFASEVMPRLRAKV